MSALAPWLLVAVSLGALRVTWRWRWPKKSQVPQEKTQREKEARL